MTADAQCVRCGSALAPPGIPTLFQTAVRTVPRVIGPLLGLHWLVFAFGAMVVAVVVPEVIRRRKAAEAVDNLQRIYDAEIRYFNRSSEESVAEFVSVNATPSYPPSATGYPASPSAWTRDPGWRALGFSIRGPHHYQYRVEASNPHSVGPLNAYNMPEPRFTVTAIGDLDGDGVLSTFSCSGYLFRGEFNRGQPTVVNPYE
ncbi:MAG: hypothetical protein Q8S73_02095 [Deltaproteobacteria bacterium]|nr:hypothetical protein [Deltaproteobacteria bacterium]